MEIPEPTENTITIYLNPKDMRLVSQIAFELGLSLDGLASKALESGIIDVLKN